MVRHEVRNLEQQYGMEVTNVNKGCDNSVNFPIMRKRGITLNYLSSFHY